VCECECVRERECFRESVFAYNWVDVREIMRKSMWWRGRVREIMCE